MVAAADVRSVDLAVPVIDGACADLPLELLAAVTVEEELEKGFPGGTLEILVSVTSSFGKSGASPILPSTRS